MNARIRKLSTVLFILVFMFSVFYPVKLCVGGEQHTEHVTVGTEEFLDEGGGRGEEITGKLQRGNAMVVFAAVAFAAVCLGFVVYNKKKTARKFEKAEQELYRKKIERDSLTGLLNKEGFYLRGKEFLEKHPKEQASIVFINVENFKLINDLYGVRSGDRFLQYLAMVIRELCRDSKALCCRYEADHFVTLTLESLGEMKGALKTKQFKAYFQPKYDMQNDQIIGAEALVRWEHPQKGTISPGVFITVFEKNGFIGRLDIYISVETCAFLKRCRDDGIPLYPISNILL